jgi:hypothetical protein
MSASRSNLQFHEFKMQRWTLIDGWMNEMKCRSSGGRAKKSSPARGERNITNYSSVGMCKKRLKSFASYKTKHSEKLQKKPGTETDKLKQKTLCSFSFRGLFALLASC